MFENISITFLRIIFIGTGILCVPLFYKLWKQLASQMNFWSTINVFLTGLFFIPIWLFTGIGSSIWISIVISPLDDAGQSLVSYVWLVFWILAGSFLSTSSRAAAGALLGAISGLLTAIITGASTGLMVGFLLGLLSSTTDGLSEKLSGAFIVGLFGAKILSFALTIFFNTFTVSGGAIFGFASNNFGKANQYKNFWKKFKI